MRTALLAALFGASVRGRIATGRRAGQRVTRLGDHIDVEGLVVPKGPRCASVAGISVHANVGIPARDRARLERLCRYVARPPVATERLSRFADGRLLYRLKHRWRDGTTHVLFEPLELVEKLAALVPPPRVNLVRYHGVLAPAARVRARVVPEEPGRDASDADPHSGCTTKAARPTGGAIESDPADAVARHPRPRNYAWAELMRRVFAVDVLECPRCAKRMRITTRRGERAGCLATLASGSQVEHNIGPGNGATDEHTPRIWTVERFRYVLHVSLNELGNAGLADSCPATEVGTKSLRLGEGQDALRRRIPGGRDPRFRETHRQLPGSCRSLVRWSGCRALLERRCRTEELVIDPVFGNAPFQ